jgi:hypothetical protein
MKLFNPTLGRFDDKRQFLSWSFWRDIVADDAIAKALGADAERPAESTGWLQLRRPIDHGFHRGSLS